MNVDLSSNSILWHSLDINSWMFMGVIRNMCPNITRLTLLLQLTGFKEFADVKSWCTFSPLQWRHNGRDRVSNHQPRDCLLNRLFRRRSKKISKLRATGVCAGNSPGTGEFPAQMASYAENVSIWWRHHAFSDVVVICYSPLIHSGINSYDSPCPHLLMYIHSSPGIQVININIWPD